MSCVLSHSHAYVIALSLCRLEQGLTVSLGEQVISAAPPKMSAPRVNSLHAMSFDLVAELGCLPGTGFRCRPRDRAAVLLMAALLATTSSMASPSPIASTSTTTRPLPLQGAAADMYTHMPPYQYQGNLAAVASGDPPKPTAKDPTHEGRAAAPGDPQRAAVWTSPPVHAGDSGDPPMSQRGPDSPVSVAGAGDPLLPQRDPAPVHMRIMKGVELMMGGMHAQVDHGIVMVTILMQRTLSSGMAMLDVILQAVLVAVPQGQYTTTATNIRHHHETNITTNAVHTNINNNNDTTTYNNNDTHTDGDSTNYNDTYVDNNNAHTLPSATTALLMLGIYAFAPGLLP